MSQKVTLWPWRRRNVMKKLELSHCYKRNVNACRVIIHVQRMFQCRSDKHTQCLWRWTGWAPWEAPQQPANLCWTLRCCPPNSVVHIYTVCLRKKVRTTLLSLFLLYFVKIMTLLMKTYRGSSSVAPLILNFSIKWRWVHNVIPWPLYSQGRNPSTHWMVGWAGSGPGLDVFWEEKMSWPYWDSNRMSPGL